MLLAPSLSTELVLVLDSTELTLSPLVRYISEILCFRLMMSRGEKVDSEPWEMRRLCPRLLDSDLVVEIEGAASTARLSAGNGM